MLWQDWVFTAGSVVFVVSLIPAVMHSDKPPLSTSIPTGIALTVFAVTYLTLSLWFSGLITFFTASMWFTLAVQRYLKQRKKAQK